MSKISELELLILELLLLGHSVFT